jgi:hypothetical protein
MLYMLFCGDFCEKVKIEEGSICYITFGVCVCVCVFNSLYLFSEVGFGGY